MKLFSSIRICGGYQKLFRMKILEKIVINCTFFLIFTRFVRQDMYHYYYPQENIQYFKTIKVNIGISCSGYYVFFLQKFAHKKMKTLISSFYFHIPKGRILWSPMYAQILQYHHVVAKINGFLGIYTITPFFFKIVLSRIYIFRTVKKPNFELPAPDHGW